MHLALQIRLRIDMYGTLQIYLYCIVLMCDFTECSVC